MTRRADVVVVGSGPGGAVTARECARHGLSVLVLEEGPWVDVGEVEPYSVAQMQRQYRNEGLTVALGLPSVAYTEARCAGGGSEVNAGLYHRPPPELLSRWARVFGIAALEPADLADHFETVEQRLSISPWPGAELPATSDVLRRGADALGWQGLDVPRWMSYSAAADGSPVPVRQSMTGTYLADAIEAGAVVETGTRVVSVHLEGGRARGVEIERPIDAGQPTRGTRREVVRAETVFVCAGATQTPALLQRSGIHAGGRVGAGFSVHPTVKAVGVFDDPINDPAAVPTYQVKEFGSWLSLGGSASRPALLALQLADHWSEFGGAMAAWQHAASYYAAIQSVGRGRVQAVPGLRDPVVTYRLTRADLAALQSGLGRLLTLLTAAGAHTVYPSYRDAPVVTSAADVPAAVAGLDRRSATVMTVHLTGTARMGEDPRRSVTDSFGRIHGVPGLRVNDAALLPEAPGVNPQGTLMAIAHRNVEEFLAG